MNVSKSSLAVVVSGLLISTVSSAEEAEQIIELSPVVVVGEKVSRAHFDTSTSAEVFDQQQLARKSAKSVNELLKETVGVVALGSGNDLPAVRGVDGSGPAQGAVAFLAGSRPRLNMLTDGRSALYNEFAFGTQSLWDMDQIEVFKGPQSFSQGRNAIAGAIVMTSKDPSFDWEGAVKLSAGNQKSQQGSAMISGPILNDELAFRLSVDRQSRESYINLPHYYPVGNAREIESTTTRAKLLYMPANFPDFFTRLTINHIRSKTPQNEALSNPLVPRHTPERPIFQTKSYSTIWDVDWQATDNIGFQNKVIYSNYRHDRYGAPHVQGVPAIVDGHEWQIEPMLRFNNEAHTIKGVVGLFFFSGSQDESVKLFNQNNVFDDKTKTQAIFAEVTYSPTPKWDITVAGRYEREKHRRIGGSSLVAVDLDKKDSVFLPKFDIAWKPTENITNGFKVSRGYNPGGAGITFDVPFVAYEYDAEHVWTYELYNRYRTADNRIEVYTNLFYNRYKDMQLPFYLGTNSVAIRNADQVNTYGAEVAVKFQATKYWQINTGVSYLKTDIKKYANSGVEGKKLSRSPQFILNLGTSYQRGPWDVSGNVHWTDKYYSDYTNTDTGKISAYTQVNLQAGYTFASSHFDSGRISLYADNILNSKRVTFIPNYDRREGLIQRPRSFGITAEFRF